MAVFKARHGSLQSFQPLVVVTLCRDDGRVAQKVSHLCQGHAAFDETRRVLVTQVVPVQVDGLEPLEALRRQVLVGACAPP